MLGDLILDMSFGRHIRVCKKYNPIILAMKDTLECSREELEAKLLGINPTQVWIKGKCYDSIPIPWISRHPNPDGYFRYIYIQVNVMTGEYYVGKVNRKRFKEIKRYNGSGVLFTRKYKGNSQNFEKFYIVHCDSAKETEQIEAEIVDDILLSDDKCLNLVHGGAGTSVHQSHEERSANTRAYMLAHPERYKSFLEGSRRAFSSGQTHQLKERSKKIKTTMSSPEYAEAFRNRLKNWRESNPEAFKESHIKQGLSARTEESKAKRRKSMEKYIAENPEEYEKWRKHKLEAQHTDEAQKKRSDSLRRWNREHPEDAQKAQMKRVEAAMAKRRKKVVAIDIETNEKVCEFDSMHDAARWLVANGSAKTINCVSSINAVCLGKRQKCYGYSWKYQE